MTYSLYSDRQLTGQWREAGAPAAQKILFGVNNTFWSTVSPSFPAGRFGWTKSFATGSGVPAAWSGNGTFPPVPGTVTLACIKPDPNLLLAGSLDSALIAFLAGAKAGDQVSAWQEWNLPSNPFWTNVAGATIGLGLSMHAYMHALVKAHRPDVEYGEVFGGSAAWSGTQTLRDYTQPGMDWYSMDGYQHKATETAAATFGAAWTGVLLAEPSARPAITEVNTTATTDGSWFTDVYSWLRANNGTLFASWWGPGTNFLYPWPTSAGNLSALQSVAALCAA